MQLILRTVVIFTALWLVLRVAGKRQVAQMDAFDLVTVIVLGGVVTQGILQEDYSLVSALVAVGLVTFLAIGLSLLSWRSERLGRLIDGQPTILLRYGQPDEVAMRAERISMGNLLRAAREHGLRSLDEADLVVLEPDGAFSFFTKDSADESDGDDAEDHRAKAV